MYWTGVMNLSGNVRGKLPMIRESERNCFCIIVQKTEVAILRSDALIGQNKHAFLYVLVRAPRSWRKKIIPIIDNSPAIPYMSQGQPASEPSGLYRCQGFSRRDTLDVVLRRRPDSIVIA